MIEMDDDAFLLGNVNSRQKIAVSGNHHCIGYLMFCGQLHKIDA